MLHSVANKMGSKPNWCCNNCGDHFSRRYSVNRHIGLKHGGMGTAIPFTQYIAGVRNGNYPPSHKPTFNRRESQFLQVWLDEYQKELFRSSVKKMLDGNSFMLARSNASPFLPGFSFTASPFISQKVPLSNHPKVSYSNLDVIFGLVQELCTVCKKFKRIEIRYGKNGKEVYCPGQESCSNNANMEFRNADWVQTQPPNENQLESKQISERLKMFLLLRIMDWTLDGHAVRVFPFGYEVDKITICMNGDSSRSVTVAPSKESIVELSQAELINYEWLPEALTLGWTPLLHEDLDSFLHLTGDRTWFYLKLLTGDHAKCYFVMLFNQHVYNAPIMVDSDL